MLSLYRLVILLGLIPLGVLTAFSVVGFFKEKALDAEPASSVQVGQQRVEATTAEQSANDDLSLLGQLKKATWESSAVHLEPKASTKGELTPVIKHWNSFLNNRQLAQEISSVAVLPQRPPDIAAAPPEVKSLAQMRSLVTQFSKQIAEAETWHEKWTPQSKKLENLKARVVSQIGTGTASTGSVTDIVLSRNKELIDLTAETARKATQLKDAKQRYEEVLETYDRAKDQFEAGKYDAALRALEPSNPKPKEIANLVAWSRFRRDADRHLDRYNRSLGDSLSQQSLTELEKELGKVLGDPEFEPYKSESDSARRTQLADALTIVQLRLKTHEVSSLPSFEEWLTAAKQIKQNAIHLKDSQAKTAPRQSEVMLDGCDIVCKGLVQAIRVRFNKELGQTKQAMSFAGSEEAILTDGTILIGAFKDFTANSVNYWKNKAAMNDLPNQPDRSLPRALFSQLPREPKPVEAANRYNNRIRVLAINLSSKKQWMDARDEFSKLEQELSEYQKRGDRDGVTFAREIQFTDTVLSRWGDVSDILSAK